MNYTEKKSLYESIMNDVAKIVKRHLKTINENNREIKYKISNNIGNAAEDYIIYAEYVDSIIKKIQSKTDFLVLNKNKNAANMKAENIIEMLFDVEDVQYNLNSQ